MNTEKTPTYIIELKNDLVKHIDTSLSDFMATIYKTVALKEDIVSIREDMKNMATKDDITKIWNTMATKDDITKIWNTMATKDDIALVWDNMATKEDIKTLATKKDFEKVYALIGKYETRASNIEDILMEDHKPRIIDLEREVFAV
jgi:hypothetical protein